MKYDFKQITSMIDTDWIEQNPYETKQLIDALVHELECRKDVIQLQREQLMLANALIEGMRE